MTSIPFNRVNYFLSKVLIVFCLVIFGWSIFSSYIEVKETLLIRTLIIGANVTAIIMLFIVLAYIANKYLTRRLFIILLAIFAFTIRLAWILKIPTPIESDFAVMYQGALQAARGDYSFAQATYFTTWVYQLGFTMYEALVMRLFGEGTFMLKLLNILYGTGATLLIYGIASKIFNEWTGRIAGIIYCLYIPNIILGSVLTNQHLAAFFFYLGFYLLITKGLTSKYMWMFIGIALSLGDIIRPLGAVVLIAIVIYSVLQGFLAERWRDRLGAAQRLVGIIVVFYLVHYIISYIFISANITQYPLSNRDPLWKFVVGLNHETEGRYSAADAEYVMKLEIGEQRRQIEMDIIKERTEDKEQLLLLFEKKFEYMWGGIDDSGFWSLGHVDKKDLQDTLMKYERFMYITTMIFGVIGLLYLFFQKPEHLHHTLFLLLIIGYVLIHLLIEVQTRYRDFIIPSFVIIQSYGVYSIAKYMKRLVSKY